MANKLLKINFVLPPCPKITGGPLAILEYANRFIERGHDVSITTYPDIMWNASTPFPWFDFKGKLIYKSLKRIGGVDTSPRPPDGTARLLLEGAKFVLRNLRNYRSLKAYASNLERKLRQRNYEEISSGLIDKLGIEGLVNTLLQIGGNPDSMEALNVRPILNDVMASLYVMEVMPECDINIATWWITAFPVYLSKRGKPVYFMQHFEEIFYPDQIHFMLHKLGARMSYSLPMYKVANSSWLQKIIFKKYGQMVPFSNNALNIDDFRPMAKSGRVDNIIQIVTYSRPEEWKGFGDAVAVMKIILEKYPNVRWMVFGRRNAAIPPSNKILPYTYLPDLTFQELAKLYATSDIAFCPSWYESFPLPPLEAMACGTAVVTTEYGTEDYARNGENALTVKSRDISGMVEAIERLINDEDLRAFLAQNGRKTAQLFNWEAAVDKREKILLDIYHGEIGCDFYKSSSVGLMDGHGVPFEQAPSDLALNDVNMVRDDNGCVYVIKDGRKRQIVDPLILEKMVPDITRIRIIDNIILFRIPWGDPVCTQRELEEASKDRSIGE